MNLHIEPFNYVAISLLQLIQILRLVLPTWNVINVLQNYNLEKKKVFKEDVFNYFCLIEFKWLGSIFHETSN